MRAPCQSTFVVHMDAQQAGYPGKGVSIKQTDSGYVLFTVQVSDDGTGATHCMVYRLMQDGTYLERDEIGAGSSFNSSFGAFDAVESVAQEHYVATVQHYDLYESWIELVHFDGLGDTSNVSTILASNPLDSVIFGTRQLRGSAEGGYVFCGFVDPPDAYARAWLVKIDSVGAIQWQQEYGHPDQSYEAISVAPYPDGGYVLAGYRLPANLVDLGWVIRTDSEGNELWRRFFGNDGGGWGAVRIAADSCILTFSSYGEIDWPFGWRQHLLTKWNPSGQVVWQTRTNYFTNVTAYDLEVLPDQSIIGVGTIGQRIALTKYSAAGDSLWCRVLKVFDHAGGHQAYDVELASDGGFLLTGGAVQVGGDPTPGLETIFVIKTDSFGCVVPGCQNVGVEEYVLDLQERLRISPNPASDQVSLSLELPQGGAVEGQVQVQLLDALGRLVLEQRVQQNLNQLRATMDVTALPTGTYYVHLRDAKRWLAGGKVVVQR
jgi:hypothetical protein